MLHDNSICCDGCGTEITWAPVVVHRRMSEKPKTACKEPQEVSPSLYLFHYCCHDCLEGRGCDCGSRMEFNDEHRNAAGEAW